MRYWLAILIFGLSISSTAAPTVIELEGATVYVARPVDAWNSDAQRLENSLDAVKNQKFGYWIEQGQGKPVLNGNPQFLKSVSDNPVTQGIQKEAENRKLELSAHAGYLFTIFPAVTLQPKEYGIFKDLQEQSYKNSVVAQGDPDTLQQRSMDKKQARALAEIASGAATTLVGAKVFGSTLGTGIGAQIGLTQASSLAAPILHRTQGALANVVPPDFDPEQYQQIDIRRVRAVVVPGQIIIAYKGEKTVEIETEAMIRAVLSVAGADTTIEQIQQSRAEDLKRRKAIWADSLDANNRREAE